MSVNSWQRPTLSITDDVDPWERLHGETARAFEAFACYRDLGAERSLRKVSRAIGKDLRMVADWSKHNLWVQRAEAWDRHLDAEKRRHLIRRQEKALDDQATIAGALLGVVAARLGAADKQLKPEQLRPSDIPRWLIAAATVQRAALGIPTKIDHNATVSVDGRITVDDLTAADRLASAFDAYTQGFFDARDRDRGPAEGEEPHYEAPRSDT